MKRYALISVGTGYVVRDVDDIDLALELMRERTIATRDVFALVDTKTKNMIGNKKYAWQNAKWGRKIEYERN
jgi:hypothetical protein